MKSVLKLPVQSCATETACECVKFVLSFVFVKSAMQKSMDQTLKQIQPCTFSRLGFLSLSISLFPLTPTILAQPYCT